jgi:hypothetical protein
MVFARVAVCWGFLHLIILASYSSEFLIVRPDSESVDIFRSGRQEVVAANDAYLRDGKVQHGAPLQSSPKRQLLEPPPRRNRIHDLEGDNVSLGPLPTFETVTKGAPICKQVDPKDISYTLVTQLSDERLWMMRHHCAGWTSNVSIAIYSNRKADAIEGELNGMGCWRVSVDVLSKDSFNSGEYPVNVLRNLAISSVKTSHFLYVDADFWLSHHTDKILMKKDVRRVLSHDPKQAIVLPAYQLRYKCMDKKDPTACRNDKIPRMPRTKLHLLEGMNMGNVTVFDPKNPHGKAIRRVPF